MYRVFTCLGTQHDPWLVLLAAIICVSTAFTTFKLYSVAIRSRDYRQLGWIGLTGVCAGSGIWATHFVAMLAYDGGFPTAYEPVATLGSLLLAIVLATAGFGVSSRTQAWAPAVGGSIVGASIGFMHYAGMRAMLVPGVVTWDGHLVVASWIAGILLGAGALIAFHLLGGFRAVLYGTGILTLAICTLHFTSMGAVAVVPDPTVLFQPSALDRPLMAMATAGVTLIVLLTALSAVTIQRSNMRCEEALREQNRRFEAALHYLPVGLSMFDAQHRLTMCNRAYREIYGLSEEATRSGTPFVQIMRDHAKQERDGEVDGEEDVRRNDWLGAHNVRLAAGKTFTDTQRLKDGRIIRVSVGPTADGGWVDVQEDITARSQQESKIEHMARHDILTGLPNRALMHERLKRAISNLEEGEGVALLFLDLDRFKCVNDTLGHGVGDALLVEVADRLRGCVRKKDTIARVGGDEFVVLIVSPQPSDDAGVLATRIIDAVSAPYELEGHKLSIGISVGIALSDGQEVQAETLLARSDLALYRAKNNGRGTFCMFEEDMDRHARRRRELEQDLRLALDRGEFELNYQPLVNLETGEVSAFEALLRWRHSQRGSVSPADFIPIAEETGLIVQIGEWVLRQACAEAANWPPHVKVAVNLSPIQFKGQALMKSVISALAASGLKPQRLELEITESALLDNSEGTLETLHKLHDFGIRIAMDDFGTGYSSLSYLRSFPFHKIKIDRCFVAALPGEESSTAIVRAICGLGRALGLSVTAEGVETQQQLDRIRQEGCTEMQGFLVSKPLSAAEAQSFFATGNAKVA